MLAWQSKHLLSLLPPLLPPGPPPGVVLSWLSKDLLAAGVGGRVLVLEVGQPGRVVQVEVDLSAAHLGGAAGDGQQPDGVATVLPDGVTVLPGWAGEAVTALAFSPDSSLLAAGSSSGAVRVWRVLQQQQQQQQQAGGAPDVAAWGGGSLPQVPGGVGSLNWLPSSPAEGCVLLSGSSNNSSLEMWHAPAGGPAPGFSRLQRLVLEGVPGQQVFAHIEVVPSQQLVVAADTPNKAVVTLHYSGWLRRGLPRVPPWPACPVGSVCLPAYLLPYLHACMHATMVATAC